MQMISKITAIITAIMAILSNFMALTPAKQVFYSDVAYGTHERQVMDIVFPASDGALNYQSVGAVLYIHGGGWISGDKSSYTKKAKSTAENYGVISASINYRYASNDIHASDILDDIDKALAKIKSMAEIRGMTCDKVMLVGASAGAHLAMLYAYSRYSTAPVKPVAVTSYSGPTDLMNDDFIFNNSLGSAEFMLKLLKFLSNDNLNASNYYRSKKLKAVSPISYVSSKCVPTLLVHGTKDTVVPVTQSREFYALLKKNGVVCSYAELPEATHSLGTDPYYLEQSNKIFSKYVETYLK